MKALIGISAVVLLLLVLLLLQGYALAWLWSAVAVPRFDAPPIDTLDAVGLLLMTRLLIPTSGEATVKKSTDGKATLKLF